MLNRREFLGLSVGVAAGVVCGLTGKAEAQEGNAFIPLSEYIGHNQVEVVNLNDALGLAYVESTKDGDYLNTLNHVVASGLKEIRLIDPQNFAVIASMDLETGKVFMNKSTLQRGSEFDPVVRMELPEGAAWVLDQGGVCWHRKVNNHPILDTNGYCLAFSPNTGWKIYQVVSYGDYDITLQGVYNITSGQPTAPGCVGMSGGPVMPLITELRPDNTLRIFGVASEDGLPLVIGEMQHIDPSSEIVSEVSTVTGNVIATCADVVVANRASV